MGGEQEAEAQFAVGERGLATVVKRRLVVVV
jgi:hypothetical protein